MEEDKKYIPPLVSQNRLKEHVDYRKTLNETGLDVGGYIRVSTKKDSQTTSIENQKKYIREWAEVNHYNLVKFYVDVKSGAYAYTRNDMQQLREDIKAGRIKGIVTKEISRTSRDIMDILELKRSLATAGSFFISLKENYDSRTDDDEFLLIIHSALAQKERKTTASRVKITQMIKAKEGKTNTSSPAFGYKLSEDKQHLEVDPEASKVYKMIVEKFLEGWGVLRINKWLNVQGYKAKRGGKWHNNSIKTILSNPVYLGISIYNTTTLIRDNEGKRQRVVRPQEEWIIRYNTHEPLITQEKFDRIQEIMKDRKEKDTKEWSCEKKYLLSGMLFCDVCKGKIFGCKTVEKRLIDKQTGKPKVYFSYVDQNRYGVCDTSTKYWNMQRVDDLVMQEIKKFFSDHKLIEDRIKAKQYLYNENMGTERLEREELLQKLEVINKAIKKQQLAFEEDIITIKEYKSRMIELREKKDDITRRLDKLNVRLEKVDNIEERFNEIKSKVLKIIDNIEQLDYTIKEALLRKLIKRIFIKADYTIKIQYTFEEE